MKIYCNNCKRVTEHDIEDGFGTCVGCGNVVDDFEIRDKLEKGESHVTQKGRESTGIL